MTVASPTRANIDPLTTRQAICLGHVRGAHIQPNVDRSSAVRGRSSDYYPMQLEHETTCYAAGLRTSARYPPFECTGTSGPSFRKTNHRLLRPIVPPPERPADMSELPPPLTPYLEPAAKELCEATDPHPRIYEVPPEEGRKILRDLQSGDGVARPDVDEEWVDVDAGQWGTVRTRIIRPKGATGPLPVVFYIHGAGWVFGDDKTHDRLFRELAVGADAAGVFPVYDRAPEAQYPTQVEQNYAVGQWILEHGAEHGLDTTRIAVTGDWSSTSAAEPSM